MHVPKPNPTAYACIQPRMHACIPQMSEVVENLEAAELAFDDLNALLDSSEGFDLSRGTWRRTGWRELDNLRKVYLFIYSICIVLYM